jgi:hypothetical protein
MTRFALWPSDPSSLEGSCAGSLGEVMTKKKTDKFASTSSSPRRDQTQREVKDFMRALRSYPERFADNPCLSFEQHLFLVASTANNEGHR